MDANVLGKIGLMLDDIINEEVARRMASEDGAYFTQRQVAKRWGVHERTVSRLILNNRLKHVRVGGAIRIRSSAIEEYESREPRRINREEEDDVNTGAKDKQTGTVDQ